MFEFTLFFAIFGAYPYLEPPTFDVEFFMDNNKLGEVKESPFIVGNYINNAANRFALLKYLSKNEYMYHQPEFYLLEEKFEANLEVGKYYLRIKCYPPISDAIHWRNLYPQKDISKFKTAQSQFEIFCKDMIDNKGISEKDKLRWIEALGETRHYYCIYDLLEDLHKVKEHQTTTRLVLDNLRSALGVEEYNQYVLPPFLPLKYLPLVK